jgi:hypothetical protein
VETRLYNNRRIGDFCAAFSLPRLFNRDSLKEGENKENGDTAECSGVKQRLENWNYMYFHV